MPGRINNYGNYRYSFNGKELDNEVKGIGNEYDYGFRIYDPRIAKFLSVDPLTHKFPWNSPYSYAEGDVVRSIDLDGTEKKQANHPMGYYSDDNHTTWKSIVKVGGDDRGGSPGGYAELRIQDENGINFFVLKTRVMHDGVVSHNLAYWTEEPLADGKKYSNEAKWEPFMEAGQEGAQAGVQMDRLFGTFWFGTAVVGSALPALAYGSPYLSQAARFAFTPKPALNPTDAAWDFVNQKFIQGRSWTNVNWASIGTSAAFGKGNFVSNALFGASGNFLNFSYNGIARGNILNFNSSGLRSFSASAVGNMISGGAGGYIESANKSLIGNGVVRNIVNGTINHFALEGSGQIFSNATEKVLTPKKE